MGRKLRRMLLRVSILLFVLCTWVMAAPALLLEKDFSQGLPDELRAHETRPCSASLSIQDKAHFEVLVHYDQLVDRPAFFRKVRVELPTRPADVQVNATVGYPINMGTVKSPLMAVPIMIQWSGAGWLRTSMWTLFADGKLEPQK